MSSPEQILQNNLEFTLFPWSAQGGLNPLNIERGEGVWIYDRSGRRYLDFSSQLIAVNIGHARKEVTEAVRAQMEKISYVFPGMITEPRGELGRRLAEIAPRGLKKTLFTLGGAEAVENAMKLARHFTGRHKIIARYRSFHGASYGAISAGGDPRKLEVDRDGVPSIIHVEDPYCYRCPWKQRIESCSRECTEHIERIVDFEGPKNIAAILMEGESGTSGCYVYPPDYWKRLRALADKHGILLIDDEVVSGFGRTGKWFAVDHAGISPDIICLAKGLTSATLPLGAMIVSDKIAAHYNDRFLPLGLTYSAHAASCAAALAVLDIYEKEGLIERAAKMGMLLAEKMKPLLQKHKSIGDFRRNGLLACIELVKNRDTKEPLVPGSGPPEAMKPMNEFLAKIRELGLFTLTRGHIVMIGPPLIIEEAELDHGLEILSRALEIADRYCV